MTQRLNAQMAFLCEADCLKSIDRQNVLQDHSRPENSAEHSWHAALFALILDYPTVKSDAQRDEIISLILIHDLVEIDAGDHPIHLEHNHAAIAEAESEAADRLFGLLPDTQSKLMRASWSSFENAETEVAKTAKLIDYFQPMIQASAPSNARPDQTDVVRENLRSGRAKNFPDVWPEAYSQVTSLLDGCDRPETRMGQQLDFLIEADRLKSIYRATRLHNNSRFENSAEHSWHIALYALILSEYAPLGCDITRVIRMLLIHDIVEIDAGDAPIHGDFDADEMHKKELAAADRLFGLLPQDQAKELRNLWDEFEAIQTPDAKFAKALDRMPSPLANIANGGGSWTEYDVTLDHLDKRVGIPIERGAPELWQWLRPVIQNWYREQT